MAEDTMSLGVGVALLVVLVTIVWLLQQGRTAVLVREQPSTPILNPPDDEQLSPRGKERQTQRERDSDNTSTAEPDDPLYIRALRSITLDLTGEPPHRARALLGKRERERERERERKWNTNEEREGKKREYQ